MNAELHEPTPRNLLDTANGLIWKSLKPKPSFWQGIGPLDTAGNHVAGARTCRPHVDAEGVLGRAQQDLRRAVPPSCHVVCQDRRRPLVRLQLGHAPRQAKVRQLHRAFAVQEQVARLRTGREARQTGRQSTNVFRSKLIRTFSV
jgi:hypothetical protein